MVHKVIEVMQESHKEKECGATHRIFSAKLECYGCGKLYNSAADCFYKDATCHGRSFGLSKHITAKEARTTAKALSKKTGVHHLQESDSVLMVWTLTWR